MRANKYSFQIDTSNVGSKYCNPEAEKKFELAFNVPYTKQKCDVFNAMFVKNNCSILPFAGIKTSKLLSSKNY